jgi:hypothetical protein
MGVVAAGVRVAPPPEVTRSSRQLLTMARENPSWGYTRLRGALENLGFDLGRSTIRRILTEHDIGPAPLRGKTMPWKSFLKAHWGPSPQRTSSAWRCSRAGASYATSFCSSSTSRPDAFTSPAHADIEATDIAVIFEQLAAVRLGDPQRTARLRHRYLALVLESLHARSRAPLPGPAPAWEEINGRWRGP